MKFLFVGLGNIGTEYDQTRHNIGFMAMDALAEKYNVKFELKRLAYHASFRLKGKEIHLIKPTTYMNLSGKAIQFWLTHEKIPIENLVVITDDLALPVGKLRLKQQGSHGGHNGLRNIEEVLGTRQYNRLRFGIGDEFSKGKQVDFVLGKFSESEKSTVWLKLDKVIEMFETFALQGVQKTMNFFNE